MLKIVYPICCGMDVHKSFLVACIASINEQGVTTYKGKRFCTFTGDLRRCATWLGENNCKDVCMEPTGMYWLPIYNILEHARNIVLAHPSTSRLSGERKQTKRTPSGLRTSSSTTWFLAALSHHQIFVSSGIWCATAENSPISPRERKPGAELLDCLQYQAG